jgi:hypothetical protein
MKDTVTMKQTICRKRQAVHMYKYRVGIKDRKRFDGRLSYLSDEESENEDESKV